DALLARLARVLKEAVNFEATPRLDRVSVNVGWSFLRSWGGLDRVTVNVNSSFFRIWSGAAGREHSQLSSILMVFCLGCCAIVVSSYSKCAAIAASRVGS